MMRAFLCTLLLCTATAAVVRAAPDAVRAPGEALLLAASEERLWLARLADGRTYFQRRDVAGAFTPIDPPFHATVHALAATGQEAYAQTDDGSFYRYTDRWSPAHATPERARLLELVSADGVLYGLLPATAAALLPRYVSAAPEAATQPFDPGAATLAMVRYDNRGWWAVAPCPTEIPATAPRGQSPRLVAVGDRLLLFWVADGAIRSCLCAVDGGDWQPTQSILSAGDLQAYWVPLVNRLPTLIVAQGTTSARRLRYFRLVRAELHADGAAWNETEAALSALPENVTDLQVSATAGFNQHLALLAHGDDRAYLCYARFEGAPTLASEPIPTQTSPTGLPVQIQTLRAGVLMAVLLCLFAFRRGSLALPLPLPAGWMPAFAFQRLAGFILDVLPWSLLSAAVLDVGWMDATQQMVAWAFDSQLNGTGLPEPQLLLWWAVTATCYVLYAFVLEAATGRTVGKLLIGTRVVAEQGGRPNIWRVAARGAFRIVEIAPPFWLLGFVLLLSRGRQRVGDIFARTAVVRRVPVAPAPPAPPDEPDA